MLFLFIFYFVKLLTNAVLGRYIQNYLQDIKLYHILGRNTRSKHQVDRFASREINFTSILIVQQDKCFFIFSS